MNHPMTPETNRERDRGENTEVSPRGFVKALFDYTVALLLIVPLAPVMLLVAVLVRLTSRGPSIYTQTRVGLGGRPYRIYKFRSMRHNCEQQGGAQWSKPGDNRVTRLGRFLRATHLDELPQLWNVLTGDMSLVGPRPERPEFVPTLQDAIPGYTDRLAVLPGVTGLAQVQLPPDTDLDSVRRKLCCDLYYVRHRTLWLDVRLCLCTGLCAVGVPFRFVRRFLAIPDPLAEQARQANGAPSLSSEGAAPQQEDPSSATGIDRAGEVATTLRSTTAHREAEAAY
jgi:lipopolysaccharide/colanic/teichoic acid biosynthesis glycosyltransferase